MSQPKYPNVTVHLSGRDGNAFAILGRVQFALTQAKISDDIVNQFIREATSGDYNHLLQTCLKWVCVK